MKIYVARRLIGARRKVERGMSMIRRNYIRWRMPSGSYVYGIERNIGDVA